MAALVEAFRRGDREAFRCVYDEYERAIYRFCRHFTADEMLARDAFQECFIRAYEHRSDLQTLNLKSWLFTIARRVCLNILRSRRMLHDVFDEGLHGTADYEPMDVFLREHIDKAMHRLPIQLREALLLRDVEGHSYQEIAAIVGIELSLAKVRVYRARLQMRKILGPIMIERHRMP
ncbi:MAG: sigma-70 family RNA polymerase sigma factor [Bradyrhizobiaceae bacterium]|nr:sigma-70 family RNA polymerase sigma factor [Bradyrhizobiaceae bacterium]